jgi:starch phosphorylase
MTYNTWNHPYEYNAKFTKRVAYFCMEFAIHQPLKIYSGGLGYLAGSHMRSAYDLKQNMIGIGMLWKHGYYDQVRNADRSMHVLFQNKAYNFLEDTDIMIPVYVNRHQVYIKVYCLRPETFGTVPIYLLSTDIPENDHLAQTITHKLYDKDTSARIAQSIVLGVGGAKLIEILGGADIYHMNEAHALPLAFHLYSQYKSVDKVKEHLTFTTHTPEKAGNEEHPIDLLDKMGFFGTIPLAEVRRITDIQDSSFSHSLAALRLAKIANGVSQLHGEVSRDMWGDFKGIAPITAITNSQNKKYWVDAKLEAAFQDGDDEAFIKRKKHLKGWLFEAVADQTGKIFDPNVLTIVWARRFAEYKRADLLLHDINRFNRIISNTTKPVQIIWAGKPYPFDTYAISVFNHLVKYTQKFSNCAVLTGYELTLSKLLKMGADVWLNTPRRPREASGTSGMTAAMNGAVNASISDGWIPEFIKNGHNGFVLPVAEIDEEGHYDEIDDFDAQNLYAMLENEVIATYYNEPKKWLEIVKNGMREVSPFFDADRMATEYYGRMYNI